MSTTGEPASAVEQRPASGDVDLCLRVGERAVKPWRALKASPSA